MVWMFTGTNTSSVNAEGSPTELRLLWFEVTNPPTDRDLSNMNTVDHLVFACPDLASGIEYIEDLFGVMPQQGGRHPSWGTHNAVLSLGHSTYFEIIAPDPDALDGFHRPEVFTGDGAGSLTTWAAALDDLPLRHARAEKAGHLFGEVLEGSRVTEFGARLKWSLTDPLTRLKDGVVPFMIDWGSSPHPSGSSPQGCFLRELRLSHPESDSVSAIFSDTGIIMRDIVKLEYAEQFKLVALIDTPRGEVQIES
jgi:hypothetical protein